MFFFTLVVYKNKVKCMKNNCGRSSHIQRRQQLAENIGFLKLYTWRKADSFSADNPVYCLRVLLYPNVIKTWQSDPLLVTDKC